MKIIINGSNGRMGKILAHMAGENNIAALVDVTQGDNFTDLDDFKGEADCVIDFSNHKATQALTSYCVRRGLPLLIAATGQDDGEMNLIYEAAKKIPVFLSPNMSLGVALLADLAQRAAKIFSDCDIEIIETHHNQKLDVPSGTALLLANRIKETRSDLVLNIGRHEHGKRTISEIGIHSLRFGSEVGTHEIIFSNGLETITLKHEARDRALFAKGALAAAEWLIKQKAGLYNMRDMLGE